jgi:hypothetical protein
MDLMRYSIGKGAKTKCSKRVKVGVKSGSIKMITSWRFAITIRGTSPQ